MENGNVEYYPDFEEKQFFTFCISFSDNVINIEVNEEISNDDFLNSYF